MFYKNILIGYGGIIISNSIRGKCHMKKYIIFLILCGLIFSQFILKYIL